MSARLVTVLRDAEARGLVGPGQVEAGIDHARVWAEALAAQPADVPERFLDLGSGGGLPGLVLAEQWPTARAVLLDARRRSGEFLTEAVGALGLQDRVRVVEMRAEDAARDPALRERHDLVVARGFAPPAVTAECGVAFLQPGGRLSASEPPGSEPGRWDAEGCARLGLGERAELRAGGRHFVVLRRIGELDERYPRRAGVPAKRPLW